MTIRPQIFPLEGKLKKKIKRKYNRQKNLFLKFPLFLKKCVNETLKLEKPKYRVIIQYIYKITSVIWLAVCHAPTALKKKGVDASQSVSQR